MSAAAAAAAGREYRCPARAGGRGGEGRGGEGWATCYLSPTTVSHHLPLAGGHERDPAPGPARAPAPPPVGVTDVAEGRTSAKNLEMWKVNGPLQHIRHFVVDDDDMLTCIRKLAVKPA